MNILICDDIVSEINELTSLLENADFPVTINQFHHPLDALKFIQTGAPIDCCFFDIVMPEMDGIALAKQFRQVGYVGKIVFLSTSKDYGPETYTVDAFSYLLKPVSANSIYNLLEKIKQDQSSNDQEKIIINISQTKKIIMYREISYVEVILHTVYFHLTDGTTISTKATFSDITARLLGDSRFVQCHRSYVVNMQDIAEISAKKIVTYRGVCLPITRSYKDTRSKFYQWKFGDNLR